MLKLIMIAGVAYLAWRHYRVSRELALARQTAPDAPSAGHYVEVDCAGCRKTNRISATRLRHRPVCGGCKARLLPGRRIVLCHVRSLDFDPALRAELDGVIKDYDRFWFVLDAHFQKKGATGTRGPVN